MTQVCKHGLWCPGGIRPARGYCCDFLSPANMPQHDFRPTFTPPSLIFESSPVQRRGRPGTRSVSRLGGRGPPSEGGRFSKRPWRCLRIAGSQFFTLSTVVDQVRGTGRTLVETLCLITPLVHTDAINRDPGWSDRRLGSVACNP